MRNNVQSPELWVCECVRERDKESSDWEILFSFSESAVLWSNLTDCMPLGLAGQSYDVMHYKFMFLIESGWGSVLDPQGFITALLKLILESIKSARNNVYSRVCNKRQNIHNEANTTTSSFMLIGL